MPARLITVLLLLHQAGCGTLSGPPDTDGASSTLDLTVIGSASTPTHFESDANDLLELAEPVQASVEPQIISGGIHGLGDVDVFDLGPVIPGDRVIVSVTAAEALNGAVALFDDAGSALLVNDHRNVYLGRLGPFVDIVIRRESQACYVAVTSTPGFTSEGDYLLGASVEFPTPIPRPNADVILLDFGGGRDVKVGSRAAIDVPAFDAAQISPEFAGMTDDLAEAVVELVRADFRGFDVTILSTTEGAQPDGFMSRVRFGAFDEVLLGVAEGVDEYNATDGQSAMVFTDTFAAFSRLNPSVQEMAQAIANVASHEIGHLLGLVHTSDPAELMDVTASLAELLVDQSFGKAPMYRAVFPLGYQDSTQILLDGVGGDGNVVFRKAAYREATSRRGLVGTKGPPARDALLLGSCGLDSR